MIPRVQNYDFPVSIYTPQHSTPTNSSLGLFEEGDSSWPPRKSCSRHRCCNYNDIKVGKLFIEKNELTLELRKIALMVYFNIASPQ